MAKISTYVTDSNVTLADKLIGTDADDLNITKNFTVGSILSLANLGDYVPYVGAIAHVDLGSNDISANSFVKLGGTSSEFLKADGSVDSTSYAPASSLLAYVPYVGATANINLGSNSITAQSLVKLGGTSSQFLKADGSVDSNTYLTSSSLQFTQVLNGSSTVDQVPVGLDTPIIVSFGPTQSNAVVSLDSGGKVAFLQAGSYVINGYGSVERQGSSGGVAIFLFRGMLNGVQVTETKAFHIDTTDISIPYEVTIPFQANDGDTFWFEVMRDSSGVDAGGLYTHTNLGGWSAVPSSQLQIWKLG